jgi:hypothetical protein
MSYYSIFELNDNLHMAPHHHHQTMLMLVIMDNSIIKDIIMDFNNINSIKLNTNRIIILMGMVVI